MALRPASLGRLYTEVAIDLGADSIQCWLPDRGCVLSEPSVVAMDVSGRRILAFGDAALVMAQEQGDKVVISQPLALESLEFRPLAGMLGLILDQLMGRNRVRKPRLLLAWNGPPSRRSHEYICKAAQLAGARETVMVSGVVAAAVGAGLPLEEPRGTMVMDLGGGSTSLAVLSAGGVASQSSTRRGGIYLDGLVHRYLQKNLSIQINAFTARRLKEQAGCSRFSTSGSVQTLPGLDSQSGRPRHARIETDRIRAVLDDYLEEVIEMLQQTLLATPPELVGDLMETGLVLCGGGARLGGLAHRLREEIQAPCVTAEAPDLATVRGLGELLARPQLLGRLSLR